MGLRKVKTEEEYFEAIKQMISAQISGNSDVLFRMQAEKQLVEEFGNFELPQEFLKKWLVRRNDGLTAENIDEEFEKMIPSLKWQLIKERIAVDTEVKIEEADVTNHAKAIARQQFAQYGMTNVEDDMLADTGLLAVDLLAVDLLAVDLLAVDLLAVDLLAEVVVLLRVWA